METKTPYFIAGLPRSGSTLLGALLAQNPRFHTEPASPVLDFITSINKSLDRNEHFVAFPKQKCASEVVKSLFTSYYSNTSKPVVFDKNRAWPAHVSGIELSVTSRAKILCPVRNIDEVLASLLRIAQANPYNPEVGRHNFIDQALVMVNKPVNDESRCELILSDHGLIGKCMLIMQNAVKKGYKDRLHFIEYDRLVQDPAATMTAIYEFLEEEPYRHDFTNIEKTSNERDSEVFNVPNLHSIRPKIEKSDTDPKSLIPDKFLKGLTGTEFWRN